MRDTTVLAAGSRPVPVHVMVMVLAIIVAIAAVADGRGHHGAEPLSYQLTRGASGERAEPTSRSIAHSYGAVGVVRADLIGTLAEAAGGTLRLINTWIVASYERAPALVLGLVVLIAIPPLTLIGVFLGSRNVPQDADLTYLATRVTRRRARGRLPDSPTEKAPAWPSEAWIELQGDGADVVRHGIGRALVRIGRESDNDIRLDDKTVHRYHAAIRLTDDAEFVITDLSSAGGNGVTVNGRAVAEARLSNGDSIELGHAKLKFIARPREGLVLN